MKKVKLLLGVILMGIAIVSCTKGAKKTRDNGDVEQTVMMTIYPETANRPNMMGSVWTQPLVFSDNDTHQKQVMIDIITEGFDFDYKRGYEYKIEAKKVWMKNPPQDVSSIKYEFVKLVSEKKAIVEDSEETILLEVCSRLVRFIPQYPSEYNEDGSLKTYNALRVKDLTTNTWMAILKIEGFDYSEGNRYKLKVNKITKAEPYSVTYVLQEELLKEDA